MSEKDRPSDLSALQRSTDALVKRYEGIFTAELVERYVFESYTALARTMDPSPDLAATAAGFAKDRLDALTQAHAKNEGTQGAPLVLFVCPYNIGRSQIAAALLSHYAGGTVAVRSAGPRPGTKVDPLIVAALRKSGIEINDAYPKPVTDDVVRAADWVVTIGRVNISLLYPGKKHLEWHIEDPGDTTPEQVEDLIAELDTRVRGLWAAIHR